MCVCVCGNAQGSGCRNVARACERWGEHCPCVRACACACVCACMHAWRACVCVRVRILRMLTVEVIGVPAGLTCVKDGLTLISRPKLCSCVRHLPLPTLRTCFHRLRPEHRHLCIGLRVEFGCLWGDAKRCKWRVKRINMPNPNTDQQCIPLDWIETRGEGCGNGARLTAFIAGRSPYSQAVEILFETLCLPAISMSFCWPLYWPFCAMSRIGGHERP